MPKRLKLSLGRTSVTEAQMLVVMLATGPAAAIREVERRLSNPAPASSHPGHGCSIVVTRKMISVRGGSVDNSGVDVHSSANRMRSARHGANISIAAPCAAF
jgi:hypothetical protein